jgi:opacity protein-like surface antigen
MVNNACKVSSAASASLREIVMIIRKRIFGLTLATAAIAAASAASAADYEPPVFEAPALEEEYVPVEVGNGWYLRGDVGYVFETRFDEPDYRTFDIGTATYASDSFDTARLEHDFTFGVGFGYRFTDYMRADVTWDMFKGKFDGTTSSPAPCDAGVEDPDTSCRSVDSSSMYGSAFMANAYFDLGTYKGFTPYIGAGAGMARVKWDRLTNQIYCVDGPVLPGDACVGNPYAAATHAAAASWRFTYSFMAGLAYDVSKNMKLDVGYRYRHVDGGDMFGWDAASAAGGATGIQGTEDGMDMHEVKVGLRYELW